MRKSTAIIIFLLLSLTHWMHGQDAALTALQTGDRLFDEQHYREAIIHYTEAIELGVYSTTLFNNLGVAYAWEEQAAKGRLYLEKAALMQPGSKLIRNNLRLIHEKLQLPLPKNEFIGMTWLKSLTMTIPVKASFSISLFFVLLALMIAWLYFTRTKILSLWQLRILFVCTLFFAGLFFCFGVWHKQRLFHTNMAIVVAEQPIALYKQPDVLSPSLVEIRSGQKVLIQQRRRSWVEVIAGANARGWVHDNAVFALRFDSPPLSTPTW